MKNPAHEQIQARKVKARLRMLQHMQRVSGNVSQTWRFFGVSKALFYIWVWGASQLSDEAAKLITCQVFIDEELEVPKDDSFCFYAE